MRMFLTQMALTTWERSISFFQMGGVLIHSTNVCEEEAASIAKNIKKITRLCFDDCTFAPGSISVICNAIEQRKGKV